ncbi:FAD:protein FMN transferase [Maribacter halichondriae]|uniref:FAD:protein FMN transferase n=1 Tax=Maribacter halichondriae TaxID=2980554 RepID=UPI0023581244|nr:FAD:protein FMN transferase [Maribacter sp. Hal144]
MSAQTRFEYGHQQMGTQIRLVFYAQDKVAADSISQKVFQRIDVLNTILSDYISDSELNRLCDQVDSDVTVSPDLYSLLETSMEISKKTDGAFDITIGPLIRLWRNARKTEILPKKPEIKDALQFVGYQNLVFPKQNTVRLKEKNMQLDVGGIGKGFAADHALKILESNGITSALIDMGGDIRVSDSPPQKSHWTLVFYYYDEQEQQVFQKLKLKNQAVATSGDLYQFVEINGVRYSHIINPNTGMALQNGIQVTTIAPTGTLADGYASAFSVLGIQKTKEKIEQIENIEVFVTERSEEKYQQWNSGSFANFTLEQ